MQFQVFNRTPRQFGGSDDKAKQLANILAAKTGLHEGLIKERIDGIPLHINFKPKIIEKLIESYKDIPSKTPKLSVLLLFQFKFSINTSSLPLSKYLL